ncbi:MAG: hypothetical protein J0M12_00885 [Deltaproteobacteria bacterium]|nr:hypothetical protein [Deltaproteobacteria bacterium]
MPDQAPQERGNKPDPGAIPTALPSEPLIHPAEGSAALPSSPEAQPTLQPVPAVEVTRRAASDPILRELISERGFTPERRHLEVHDQISTAITSSPEDLHAARTLQAILSPALDNISLTVQWTVELAERSKLTIPIDENDAVANTTERLASEWLVRSADVIGKPHLHATFINALEHKPGRLHGEDRLSALGQHLLKSIIAIATEDSRAGRSARGILEGYVSGALPTEGDTPESTSLPLSAILKVARGDGGSDLRLDEAFSRLIEASDAYVAALDAAPQFILPPSTRRSPVTPVPRNSPRDWGIFRFFRS